MCHRVFAALLVITSTFCVQAGVTPLTPGPGDIFFEGQPCSATWDIDPTGHWESMTIELMTGNNFDMVHLATLATVNGVDSSQANFSYTCPQVSPHSAIYFYQFSSLTAPGNITWTSRFTITDLAKNIVSPLQSKQADGAPVPWGIGRIVTADRPNGTSSAVPPVSTFTNAGIHNIVSTSSAEFGSFAMMSTSLPSAVSASGSTPVNAAVITPSLSGLFLRTVFALCAFALSFVAVL